MLAGLALIAVLALKVVPAPVKSLASTAASVTPAGRAVAVAKAVKPAPAGPEAVPDATPRPAPKPTVAERSPGVGYSAQRSSKVRAA